MRFAGGVTASLLGKLGTILAEEAGLLAGVEDDIQYIMEELKSMDSFLAVLSSSLDHDKQVKTWMEQVRDLAYDAEDCVDVFRHRLRRPRHQHPLAGGLLHAVRLLRTLKARHSVATDLRNLKLRARDVSERHARYDVGIGPPTGGAICISSSTAASSSGLLRRSAAFLKEVGHRGMDHYKHEIVGQLMEKNDPQLRVISIVGNGGLGKTTLAKMVYQSSAVTGGYFQARAWIEMPRCFKIEPLLRNMIRQFSSRGRDILDILGVDPMKQSFTVFSDDKPFHNYGKMRLLRVLDLQGCKGLRHNHLKNISRLFLLSFLSLRNTSVEELPDSIGDLQNLQTLDIRGTGINKFPGAAVELKKLAYLLAGTKFHFEANRAEFSGIWSYESMRMPTGVGKMKGLRKLGLITVTDSTVLLQIGKLTQLQKLSIDVTVGDVGGAVHIGPEDTRRQEHLVDLLSKLDGCLRSLTILDSGNGNGLGQILNDLRRPPLLLHDIQLVGVLQTLPDWVASLNRIVKITLRFTSLTRDAVRVLANLPALAQLVLGYKSLVECDEQLVFDRKGFKGLKLLHIESVEVSFQEGALPNLEWLKLIGHFGDQSVSGMKHLHSLEEVYLDIGDERLQEKLRKKATKYLKRTNFVVA
ncbi:NB-ARC domain [Musa troglodytarum]|uniref:NB-ARC domain n=1 Tax=Musa troglodytarum TaxID=320322 RepID=A0A9E7HEQ6_9LILI|nr:NB-ARC domain [Musa troglodytarum]